MSGQLHLAFPQPHGSLSLSAAPQRVPTVPAGCSVLLCPWCLLSAVPGTWLPAWDEGTDSLRSSVASLMLESRESHLFSGVLSDSVCSSPFSSFTRFVRTFRVLFLPFFAALSRNFSKTPGWNKGV